MGFDINKFISTNPFANQGLQAQTLPVSRPVSPESQGVIAAGNPFKQQVSFAGLQGRTENGLSFLRPEQGQTGLGNNAIVTQNGELGRKLFGIA
ncbi:MAG: hypothetical protein WCG23_11925 [bacterium]